MTEEQMKNDQKCKLRKVGILCLHCIRNLAYYKERRKELFKTRKHQFWLTVDGNFLDICVLEWCKLFADKQGEHYWKRVVSDDDQFLCTLLKELTCSNDEFEKYVKEMKSYRDKFIAHLDNENTMKFPWLDKAEKSIFHLYCYLLAHEEIDDCFYDAPEIMKCFCYYSSEAKAIYDEMCEKMST